MKINGLDVPPPAVWALLDMLIAAVVRRWRAETETYEVPWSESALALKTMAVRASINDPIVDHPVDVEIRMSFEEAKGVAGRYFAESDKRIDLYVGSKNFQSYVRPTDEHVREDLLTLVHYPFAHEYQHKRQDLIGEIPALDAWPLHLQSGLMYLDRPWEQDAFAADIAYRLATTQPGTTRFSEARVRSYVLRELNKQHGTTEARDVIVKKVIKLLQGTGWLTE